MPFIVVVIIVCFVAWPLIPFLVVTAWPLICFAAFFVAAVIATLAVFVIVERGRRPLPEFCGTSATRIFEPENFKPQTCKTPAMAPCRQ